MTRRQKQMPPSRVRNRFKVRSCRPGRWLGATTKLPRPFPLLGYGKARGFRVRRRRIFGAAKWSRRRIFAVSGLGLLLLIGLSFGVPLWTGRARYPQVERDIAHRAIEDARHQEADHWA